MTILADVEWVDNARSSGGTYLDGVPWRVVFHTTEVVPATTVAARRMAARHEYPPHLWAWPEKDWLVQTVPLDRSAFALLHPRGTPETNKMRALQVEIIGLAAETPGWPHDWWEWLGRRVVRPVVDAGYDIDLDRVAPLTATGGYGADGKVRFTADQWRGFDGLCAHENVPDNHHWDIGGGRLDLVAAAARPAPQPPSEEDDMAASPSKFLCDSDGHSWLVNLDTGRVSKVAGTSDLSALAKLYEHIGPVSKATLDGFVV